MDKGKGEPYQGISLKVLPSLHRDLTVTSTNSLVIALTGTKQSIFPAQPLAQHQMNQGQQPTGVLTICDGQP